MNDKSQPSSRSGGEKLFGEVQWPLATVLEELPKIRRFYESSAYRTMKYDINILCEVIEHLTATQSEIADTITVPRSLLKDLLCYGEVHTVSGVVYGAPHSVQLDRLRILLSGERPGRAYCESCGYVESHDPNCPRDKGAGSN